ncbi:rhomboid family intramembrane serine protease [Flavobacteriaceae bacterium Ap0902]|nr:rhomboid family intramembrane serine protease [Flavobacteriaceae bacterium Ap0902]
MFKNIPQITKNLLILNTLFFAAKYLLMGSMNLDVLLGAFFPLSDNFKSYQIISHMFMHANFTHFLFNMFALWMFGSTVERALGEKKYLILYFAAGLGAFALFNITNYIEAKTLIDSYELTGQQIADLRTLEPGMGYDNMMDLRMIYSTPMMGASGAIFGVLAAFGVMFPNAILMLIFPPIPMKAKYFIPIYIAIELYLAVQANPGDNVAHYAHLGGALIGFILVKIWKNNTNKPQWQ